MKHFKSILKIVIFLPIFMFAQSETKILTVLTNCGLDNNKDSTGFWFNELTHFYHIFEDTKYQIDFVSVNGGAVPIDPASIISIDDVSKQYVNNPNFMKKLNNTLPVNGININEYSVIYFVGGHGAMWDFADNTQLQKITAQIYENNGIVSAVCHGTAGLLNTKLSDGNYLIHKKNITGFSNIEEGIVGKKNVVPFLLQDEIENRNAHYKKNFLPFTSNIVIDGRIMTGQNPNSTTELAKSILDYLNK